MDKYEVRIGDWVKVVEAYDNATARQLGVQEYLWTHYGLTYRQVQPYASVRLARRLRVPPFQKEVG